MKKNTREYSKGELEAEAKEVDFSFRQANGIL